MFLATLNKNRILVEKSSYASRDEPDLFLCRQNDTLKRLLKLKRMQQQQAIEVIFTRSTYRYVPTRCTYLETPAFVGLVEQQKL